MSLGIRSRTEGPGCEETSEHFQVWAALPWSTEEPNVLLSKPGPLQTHAHTHTHARTRAHLTPAWCGGRGDEGGQRQARLLHATLDMIRGRSLGERRGFRDAASPTSRRRRPAWSCDLLCGTITLFGDTFGDKVKLFHAGRPCFSIIKP